MSHNHDCTLHACWRPGCCDPRQSDCIPECPAVRENDASQCVCGMCFTTTLAEIQRRNREELRWHSENPPRRLPRTFVVPVSPEQRSNALRDAIRKSKVRFVGRWKP